MGTLSILLGMVGLASLVVGLVFLIINSVKKNQEKRKKGRNIMIGGAVLFIVAFIMLMKDTPTTDDNIAQEAIQDSQEEQLLDPEMEATDTVEKWREFDKRADEDFKKLYKAYNKMLKAMESEDQVAMYTYMDEIEEFMVDYSVYLNYGDTQEEKDYISVLNIIALEEQALAKNVKKHLDSGSLEDLNKANKSIDNIKQAISTYASNRGTLLSTKAQYTDEEIQGLLSEYDNLENN